jgi:hypothetical protein
MIWSFQNRPEEGKRNEIICIPHAAAGRGFVVKLYIQKFTG